MHRFLAAGHMAQPYGGAEYSDVSGDPNIHHHSGYLLAVQGMEARSRRLLDLDLRKAQAVAVARLGGSQLGQGLDGDNHVLGRYRGTERHGELR